MDLEGLRAFMGQAETVQEELLKANEANANSETTLAERQTRIEQLEVRLEQYKNDALKELISINKRLQDANREPDNALKERDTANAEVRSLKNELAAMQKKRKEARDLLRDGSLSPPEESARSRKCARASSGQDPPGGDENISPTDATHQPPTRVHETELRPQVEEVYKLIKFPPRESWSTDEQNSFRAFLNRFSEDMSKLQQGLDKNASGPNTKPQPLHRNRLTSELMGNPCIPQGTHRATCPSCSLLKLADRLCLHLVFVEGV